MAPQHQPIIRALLDPHNPYKILTTSPHLTKQLLMLTTPTQVQEMHATALSAGQMPANFREKESGKSLLAGGAYYCISRGFCFGFPVALTAAKIQRSYVKVAGEQGEKSRQSVADFYA